MKHSFSEEDDLTMRTVMNDLELIKERLLLTPEELVQLIKEQGFARVYFLAVPLDVAEYYVKTGKLHVRGGQMAGDTSQKSTGFTGPRGNFANLNMFKDPDSAVKHFIKTYERGYLWESAASNGFAIIALRMTEEKFLKLVEAGVLTEHNMHFSPWSFNLAMSQLWTDFVQLTLKDAIVTVTRVNLPLLKKKLTPGSSLGINTKFGEKNFVTNKLTAGEIDDFLKITHRGEIEATNFQMKEAKVALCRLIDLSKADVAENVKTFATEWEKLSPCMNPTPKTLELVQQLSLIHI